MRNHAAKQSAGYQAGVVKGDGASLGRPRVFTTTPWAPPAAAEPQDDRERRGRAAFDAHRARLEAVFPNHPTWSQMPPISREAWCDAAEAARRAP